MRKGGFAERWRSLGTVGQVRVVFAVLATLAVGGQIPVAATANSHLVSGPVAVACALVLIAVWWVGLRLRRFPPGTVVIESVAIVGLTIGLDDPHRALGPVYAMVFLRCLFGTHLAAAGRAVAYLGALYVIFSSASESHFAVFIPASFIFMTGTMRILHACLERIAQASELSASLANTAGAMLSASTPQAVMSLCVKGAAKLAPQAQVFVGRDTGDSGQPTSLRLDLSGAGVLHVVSPRPVSAQRRSALQTLVAQASTAMDSLALRSQLAYRATHDGLTSLPNRAAYTEALSAALASGTRCAALFIDLDDFKTVNDTLGHAAGDALLAQVADRVRGTLRTTDLAARLGGDEFAVLVQDPFDVHAAASAVAGRVLGQLEEPFDLIGAPFYVRCSIGVAIGGQVVSVSGSATTFSDHEVENATAALLRNADIAMYVAKARGKNRFEIFAPDMAEAVASDLDSRQELAAALARDEFELYFQPIVALPSHDVQSVEALIRWRHPEHGILPPGRFLPLAEKTRLLADIERWVIAAACQEAATWPGERPPAVSVNISPRHLSRSWLLPTVAAALATSGLPGNRLLLEITEEALIVDPVAAEANLRGCVALGVRIAVDDFGAGHASLGTLRSFPISTVKMDRSLIVDEEGQRVVSAVVELAHALGLDVVAEGVETDAQLRRIRDSGCDAVQGYLFARPAPANALDLGSRAVEAVLA